MTIFLDTTEQPCERLYRAALQASHNCVVSMVPALFGTLVGWSRGLFLLDTVVSSGMEEGMRTRVTVRCQRHTTMSGECIVWRSFGPTAQVAATARLASE